MIKMTNNIKKLYWEILEHITHTNTPIKIEMEHQGEVREFYVWQKRINSVVYIAVQEPRKLVIYSISKKTGRMDFITDETYEILKMQGRDLKTGWIK